MVLPPTVVVWCTLLSAGNGGSFASSPLPASLDSLAAGALSAAGAGALANAATIRKLAASAVVSLNIRHLGHGRRRASIAVHSPQSDVPKATDAYPGWLPRRRSTSVAGRARDSAQSSPQPCQKAEQFWKQPDHEREKQREQHKECERMMERDPQSRQQHSVLAQACGPVRERLGRRVDRSARPGLREMSPARDRPAEDRRRELQRRAAVAHRAPGEQGADRDADEGVDRVPHG